MAKLTFSKATKEQAKLRLAVFGPSGAGKTFTSLRIATGLGGRIAVIDTERGSASKYADHFDFDVLELPASDVATYVEGIKAAAGYNVLIIDSLSHAWRELLADVDRIARAKYGGNTWSAWSEGTPKQNALINALLGFDGHVIATMRSKTEWVIQQDSRGKNTPQRIGTSPEQGKGIEYEFDLLMEISADHVGTVTKDRTGRYQDSVIDKPGEELGASLAEWLTSGDPPPHWIDDEDTRKRFWAYVENSGMTKEQAYEALGVEHIHDYTGDKRACMNAIDAWAEAHAPEPETETVNETLL
jgi:hypothetical protein